MTNRQLTHRARILRGTSFWAGKRPPDFGGAGWPGLKRLRKKSCRPKKRASRAKAHIHFGRFTARPRSCPDTKVVNNTIFPQPLKAGLRGSLVHGLKPPFDSVADATSLRAGCGFYRCAAGATLMGGASLASGVCPASGSCEKEHPSGAESPIFENAVAARLKPCPFKTRG
jgi:hypothetical protein